ncbi:MAG: putative endonuclease [Brevundimonas sp.]|jgi:putative endonuclease|uniref:GIY-YIG nuclease family protein n=1 Tax=Brevundimonas sp. TaxID=1871086 RepID=UPI0039E6F9AD
MRAHGYWVYILASGPCGWLYVGMTNDLVRRVEEHRRGQVDGYTREKGIDGLVWYEAHQYVDQAILREKRIKRWRRPWKFALVEAGNPQWVDLYPALVARGVPSRIAPCGASGMTRG